MTAQLKRRIVADDIYNFKMISEPQFSPDGSRVAYVVTMVDKDSDGYRSSIFVAGASDGSVTRLTTAAAQDSRPLWTPDGNYISFISDRTTSDNEDGKKQIWMIRTLGGEAWQVSNLDEGILNYAISPDGSSFVAVSKSASEESDHEQTNSDEDSDVKHITSIRYKFNGLGFLDQKPMNLWIVNSDGGDSRQITDGPSDDRDPVWSPNGREIAFITNRTKARELNYSLVTEIWTVSAQGGVVKPVFGGDSAHFSSASWSPDSTRLAAIGHWEAHSGGATDNNIWVSSSGESHSENVTADFPRSTSDSAMSDIFKASDGSAVWTPDGSQLIFLASDSGSTQIYAVTVATGEAAQVTNGKRRISGLSLSSAGDRIAYIAATTMNPGDLYVSNIDGTNETRLTRVNEKFLSEVALAEPEEFSVSSQSDDMPIQGWIIKPIGFDQNTKYPMILEIHGGPHGMYANAFFHEFQLLAAEGYVVVYTNPRGSSGYGEEFTKATHLCWGEADMPDLMAAVDHVLEQGYVDENRMGVTGGSYGGFMTLWVIGHTDRFRAAVTQRCVSNLNSFYGTSDIGWTFIDYEFGGKAWENRDRFVTYSPLTYVKEMTTPLLIIHSEEDYRCPIEQAEQVFISLKKLGRETEFVRFPDENHDLSRSGKPKHRIERLNFILEWFNRHM